MKVACVSTWGDERKFFGAFMETAKRHGIEPQNADHDVWPGDDWQTIPWWKKSTAQAKYVREHPEYDIFMLVDSYDVVFAAGWDEILKKYDRFKSPIVWAAECYPWPKVEQAPLYPGTPHRCKYLNAGFWISTREAALGVLADIEKTSALRLQCDQGIAVDLFLLGGHPIVLDTACSLCFCCNIDSQNYLDFSGKRLKTTDTGEEPCLFHGNGNSDLRKIIAHICS